MKRIISILLTGLLITTVFSGCGNTEEKAENSNSNAASSNAHEKESLNPIVLTDEIRELTDGFSAAILLDAAHCPLKMRPVTRCLAEILTGTPVMRWSYKISRRTAINPYPISSMIAMKGFLISEADRMTALDLIHNAGIDALARDGAMLHIFLAEESGLR